MVYALWEAVPKMLNGSDLTLVVYKIWMFQHSLFQLSAAVEQCKLMKQLIPIWYTTNTS